MSLFRTAERHHEDFHTGDRTDGDVTEKERTVESTVDQPEATAIEETTADHGDVSLPEEQGYDDAAESFLELEADFDAELDETPDRDGRRGLVTDGERIDASAVPDGYPTELRSDDALALTVDLGDGETTVYFEWPDEAGQDTRLARLLDAMGIDLGDLYGREVLLARTDGYDVIVTPSEQPRETGTWGLGVAGGHLLNALMLTAMALAGGSLPFFLLWLVVTTLWVPYATYKDGWYLRTHSDWDGGPLFWATLSAIPLVNLLVGFAYLQGRARATFLGDEPSLRARFMGALRSRT